MRVERRGAGLVFSTAMGRKPSTEKKKRGPKRLKKSPKLEEKDETDQSLRELPVKKKSRDPGNVSVTAKIDMQAVTAEDVVTPKTQDGEVILDVECGPNKATLFLSKLCQGSKGPCISFQGTWLTPNEFQFVSGRETAKDWKRSIRHNGKSIKLLMAKDILTITTENTKSGGDSVRFFFKSHFYQSTKRLVNGNSLIELFTQGIKKNFFQASFCVACTKSRVEYRKL